MASTLETIRQSVYDAIAAKKAASGYILNTFGLEWTYLPYQRLQDIPTGGKVWIIGMGSDDGPNQTRQSTCRKEVPIQVALQYKLTNPQDKATINTLLELEEQLRDTCRKLPVIEAEEFAWLRTEALKDENETPYSFMGLREGNIFEAYFTVFYLTFLE